MALLGDWRISDAAASEIKENRIPLAEVRRTFDNPTSRERGARGTVILHGSTISIVIKEDTKRIVHVLNRSYVDPETLLARNHADAVYKEVTDALAARPDDSRPFIPPSKKIDEHKFPVEVTKADILELHIANLRRKYPELYA